MYAAYGDKKRLFLEAVQLYVGDPAALGRSLAEAPSAAAAVRRFLNAAAVTYTGKTTPPGCLLASATAGVSDVSIDVQLAVSQVRRRITGYVKARIAHDIENETLPADTDADALSGGVMAIALGMSVLARDGLRRPALLAIAQAYLRAWPTQAAPDLA